MKKKNTKKKSKTSKRKPIKKKKGKKGSKQAKKKVSKTHPQYNRKIQKVLSDKSITKSAKFIKLYGLGLSNSEIRVITNSHSSFVHSVISKFKKKKD